MPTSNRLEVFTPFEPELNAENESAAPGFSAKGSVAPSPNGLVGWLKSPAAVAALEAVESQEALGAGEFECSDDVRVELATFLQKEDAEVLQAQWLLIRSKANSRKRRAEAAS